MHWLAFVAFSILTIALPLSGTVASAWAAMKQFSYLWLLLPVLGFALVYLSQRPVLLRAKTLIGVAVLLFILLSLLMMIIVTASTMLTGASPAGSQLAALTDRALLADVFLRSQAALVLILLVWRATSSKPSYADNLRPPLARAAAAARSLLQTPFEDEKYEAAQLELNEALKAVQETIPEDGVSVHPWETPFLSEIGTRAEEAGELTSLASASMYSRISTDEQARSTLVYWSRFR